jgi:hypothetical protein
LNAQKSSPSTTVSTGATASAWRAIASESPRVPPDSAALNTTASPNAGCFTGSPISTRELPRYKVAGRSFQIAYVLPHAEYWSIGDPGCARA